MFRTRLLSLRHILSQSRGGYLLLNLYYTVVHVVGVFDLGLASCYFCCSKHSHTLTRWR